MHREIIARRCAIAAVIALAGTTAVAEDFDATGQAGQYAESVMGTTVRGTGGSFDNITVYVPWITEASLNGLTNAAAVETVNGNPVGAVGVGGGTSLLHVLAILGTTDAAGGGLSNNIIIDDGGDLQSNPLGTLLPDGTLVWREAFAGVPNNLGYEENITGITPQIPFPEPNAASNKVFSSTVSGIDGGTDFVGLGTPGAVRNPANGNVLTACTVFAPDEPAFFAGTGVWEGTNNTILSYEDVWFTNDPDGMGPLGPVVTIEGEPSGNLRTTQPVMANIAPPAARGAGAEAPYVAFGFSVSNGVNLGNGSTQPYTLIVDRVDGDGWLNAAIIRADGGASGPIGALPFDIAGPIDPTKSFLDHQATGGGGGPFQNSNFDMNEKGQIAVVWEDTATDPDTYEVRRYDPIWSGGRIVGYNAPIVVARNGEDCIIEEASFLDSFGLEVILEPFSGVALDEHGNVAFAAITDAEVLDRNPGVEPVRYLTTNTLFYWTDAGFNGSADEALHAVIQSGQNGATLSALNAGADYQLGFFAVNPTSNGDTFTREGLSEDGRYIAINARGNTPDDADINGGVLLTTPNETEVDATLIIDLGNFTVGGITQSCDGDANADGAVDVNDISFVIFRLGNTGVCADGDANGDGVVDVNDLSYVIFRLGTCNPGNPCAAGGACPL